MRRLIRDIVVEVQRDLQGVANRHKGRGSGRGRNVQRGRGIGEVGEGVEEVGVQIGVSYVFRKKT